VFPSSACPKCHKEIKAYDNIPVVSWLLLGGRCRNCREPINPRYAVVELIVATLFLACYWRFGPSLGTLKYCVFSFLTTGLIFIDAEHKLLPDVLTLPGLVAGLVFSWFIPVDDLLAEILPAYFQRARGLNWHWLSLSDAVLGAIVGSAFIFGVGFVYLHARGVEGMGLGDVKLMAMVGAFLGVKLTVFTIFSASLLGTVFGLSLMLSVWFQRTHRRMMRNRETRQAARKHAWASARLVYRHYQIPFGVFLGSMALVALFFGKALMGWYWRLYL
jgi:leader peptidase (prepilin peptidase)/N-methyltransferase